MNKLVIVMLMSAMLLPFAAAHPVHAGLGPYEEPCAGVYPDDDTYHLAVVCAGKGIVSPHPDDCQAYYDTQYTGKSCFVQGLHLS